MNAVFLKLINMSLTASLLILAVLPIRLLMKNAPKQMTCLLWGIVAVALVCPVRFESRASVLPVTDPIVITQNDAQATDTLPLYQEEPILIQDIIEQKPLPTKPNYVEIGGIIWCMGMLALLGYAAFSWLRLKRRVAASVEIEKHVYLCDDIDTPFILGMLRPHIYLPSSLDETTAQQVLVHERAHLARKDHWWKPLGYLLLTVHWFNPLVWVAYSLLCTDIELACDEKVIKDMDSGSKQAYSEALLTCSMPRHMIAACPLAFGEVGVKQRIKAVLHYKKPAFWVILIALVVCVALCAGFLTKPVVKTLGELNNHRRDQFDTVAIGNSERYVTINTNLSELFDILEQVEVHPVEQNTKTIDRVIVLSSENMAWSAYLNFSTDYSYLWISYDTSLTHKSFAPGQQNIWNPQGYEVLNPEILQNIDLSEFSSSSTNAIPSDEYPSFEEMQTLLEEHLRNKNRHFDNLQILDLAAHDLTNNVSYAIVTLDQLSHDGAVTAENCLYLVGFTNDRVDGMAAGQWPGDAGYYPNVADFNGNLVLWSARSGTRAALNTDGTINPNETVPNDYDEYRITFDNGNTTFYELGEGRSASPMIDLIPQGRLPVKIAPIDYYGFEVEAFTFTEDALTPTNVNTISEVSGWDAFLNMDADSGEILSIYSYPTLQETPVYLDMDESFRGYEALYHAIKTDGIEALADTVGITLMAHQSYDGYEYAVIRQKAHPADEYGLLEYTVNADGTVTLLDYGRGSAPEVMGKFGYAMSCATMNGGTLYWTLFTDERWATTADGTETDNTKTVPTDYTGFRFIWADLQEKEYPAEGSFFLAEVDSVIPPAIAIPMVGDTAITALGLRLP